jgi:competence protein ComEC
VRVIRNAAAGKLQMAAAYFRSMVIASIDKYLDERYSGFLNAILVGDKSSLDSSLTDDFIRTGTVHVIAISGLNTALIAGMLMALFKFFRIKKKMNIMITSAAIIFYCFVAGANPPVVRATVMFVIIAIGYLIDRESDMLNSLAIAAFAILLWNPKELFDPSFQLSFASIAGIVLFTPGIEAILPNSKNYFIKSIAVSLAAIISVAPIVARYFNIISPVALIANLVIVPALFVITVAAFVFLFFSFIGFSAPAACFAGALSFLTKTTFYLNHIFAMMPFSHIRLPAPPLPFIFAYYALMLLFFFSGRKKELVMALFLALNLYVWGHIFLPQEHKELKITFMDVGKGDSMLLEFPDGGTMLIDTGTGGIEGLADMGRSVVAPYLWNKNISSIDAVVSTHFHQDHVGGILYVLKNFRIGCVMDGGISGGPVTRLYDSYRREVSRSNLRRLVICDGDEILGFGDVKMFVINPREGHTGADPNESSVVIKLEYGSFTALLCGDVSGDAIGNMLKYGNFLKSDVLKVPHHGGSTGKRTVTDMFLKKVSPKVLVISSGAGFSSRKSLQPDNYDAPAIYGTKNNGAIEITTDGSNFTVRPFCKNN